MEQKNATLCKGGCGFYGSSSTEGFCSKCFKASLKRMQDTARLYPNNNANSSNVEAAKIGETVKHVPVLTAQMDGVTQSLCSSEPSSKVATELVKPAGISPLSSSPAEEAVPSSSGPSKTLKRCQVCNSRLGVIGGFSCRCGGVYCSSHRYGSEHNCDFDYKTMEREEIKKNNPLVVCDKIQRI